MFGYSEGVLQLPERIEHLQKTEERNRKKLERVGKGISLSWVWKKFLFYLNQPTDLWNKLVLGIRRNAFGLDSVIWGESQSMVLDWHLIFATHGRFFIDINYTYGNCLLLCAHRVNISPYSENGVIAVKIKIWKITKNAVDPLLSAFAAM